MRYYTGIGAHATPVDVLDVMAAIARWYAGQGVVLRSGGSPGADVAFELGCGDGPKEIYVPWAGFNGNSSPLTMTDDLLERVVRSEAWWALREALAAEKSPVDLDLSGISNERQRLYARDVCQVLGADLTVPSERVVCWTPPSGELEGTRIALYVANYANVPIDNLSDATVEERWRRIVLPHDL